MIPTVGIFDSGVGGLSIWREIVRILPWADTVYVADQAHCPYGRRTMEEIRGFAEAITSFLLKQGACVVVVACNTASAAALYDLRAHFDVPIVGMEPAVKPAAERTRTRRVGVIATPVTFQGVLFERLVQRFARDVEVITQACPDLVEQVERGELDSPRTLDLLHRYLDPMVAQGIDELVLGCTHYPFLRPAIDRVVGPGVEVIDPAPAVARQTARMVHRQCPTEPRRRGNHRFYTSGALEVFAQQVERLVGITEGVGQVRWNGSQVEL